MLLFICINKKKVVPLQAYCGIRNQHKQQKNYIHIYGLQIFTHHQLPQRLEKAA